MIPENGHPAPAIRLLIAEDEEHLGAILDHFLRGRGYEVTMCRDGRAALEALHTTPFDVALLDIVMPEMDGLEVLRHLQSELDPPEVIIITGNGTIDTAITAIKLGAYDYISKPYRMAEIDVMVRRAWEKRELGKANVMLRARVREPAAHVTSRNAGMQALLARLAELAPGSEPLVLSGERGVGKSYLARHVHALSGRPRDALVELAARGGKLVGAGDLVGREGTAAGSGGAGALLLAERGTVVVDLDHLDQDAFGALRDAVAQGWYVRLGGSRRIPLTARVIACSRGGETPSTFSGLGGDRLLVPPLRERAEDIEQLAGELLARVDGGTRVLAPETAMALRRYAWPGNVGELSLVLARAALLAQNQRLNESDVRMLTVTGSLAVDGEGAALDELERIHIENMLVRCNWHQGRAASALGISTKTLYRKMKEYGFQRPRRRKLAPTRSAPT